MFSLSTMIVVNNSQSLFNTNISLQCLVKFKSCPSLDISTLLASFQVLAFFSLQKEIYRVQRVVKVHLQNLYIREPDNPSDSDTFVQSFLLLQNLNGIDPFINCFCPSVILSKFCYFRYSPIFSDKMSLPLYKLQ